MNRTWLLLYSIFINCRCILLVFFITFPLVGVYAQKKEDNKHKYILSGFVKDHSSQEALSDAYIYSKRMNVGTTSNRYGFFSLVLEVPDELLDSLSISASFTGYETAHTVLREKENKPISYNFNLIRKTTQLEEVVVRSSVADNLVSQNPQMSTVRLSADVAKLVPTLLGEKDMLKVLQLMPGIQKASEGSTGLYVRGGGPDQNLIILDEAPVYNAAHLFGFFSIFNGNAIKNMTLYKGGFPARYGGRISSVIDVQMKEGNKQKMHGEASLGLIAANLTVEGPLIRGKTSYLVSARRSFLDLLTNFSFNGGSARYYFYDFTVKINHEFSNRDKIYLSTYAGKDDGNFTLGTGQTPSTGKINWGNLTTTFRWNHLINQRLFANTSLIYSQYQYNVAAQEGNFAVNYSSGIRDLTAKLDIDYVLSPRSLFKVGALWTSHVFTPESSTQQIDTIRQNNVSQIKANEYGIYLENTLQFRRVKLNTGLRYSGFAVTGKTYTRPELRFSGLYTIKNDWGLKLSFAQMNQYVQLLSNSGIGLPTDLWVPSTRRLSPQQGYQVAAGVARDITRLGTSVSLETYYKKSTGMIAYKQGSNAFVINGPQGLIDERQGGSWEDKVVTGQGWSYGTELLIQKQEGRFTGWLGYTLSWTQQQFDSLNDGRKFWAKYDRRHDISLVGFYKLKPTITLTATWVYSSGNLYTLPTVAMQLSVPELNPAKSAPLYSATTFDQRNNFRAEAYHRMDIGCQFTKNKPHHSRIWEVSVYNVYNHLNPFVYKLVTKAAQDGSLTTSLAKVALFPIIPSISYKIVF